MHVKAPNNACVEGLPNESCAQAILKSATRDLHVRAEQAMGDEPFKERRNYVQMLRSNLAVADAVWRMSVPHLEPCLIDGLGADISRLRSDLVKLNQTADCEELALEIGDPAAAFGAVYVMEGSRLGARLLARRAEITLKLGAENGAAYLNGDGTAAGLRWRHFVNMMNLHVVSPEEVARSLAAARRTFLLVITEFKRF